MRRITRLKFVSVKLDIFYHCSQKRCLPWSAFYVCYCAEPAQVSRKRLRRQHPFHRNPMESHALLLSLCPWTPCTQRLVDILKKKFSCNSIATPTSDTEQAVTVAVPTDCHNHADFSTPLHICTRYYEADILLHTRVLSIKNPLLFNVIDEKVEALIVFATVSEKADSASSLRDFLAANIQPSLLDEYLTTRVLVVTYNRTPTDNGDQSVVEQRARSVLLDWALDFQFELLFLTEFNDTSDETAALLQHELALGQSDTISMLIESLRCHMWKSMKKLDVCCKTTAVSDEESPSLSVPDVNVPPPAKEKNAEDTQQHCSHSSSSFDSDGAADPVHQFDQ